MTSAIIIHYRHPEMTANLVQALRSYCAGSVGQIIVVSNAAPEPYKTVRDEVVVHTGSNLGYAGACNTGARVARPRTADDDLLLFLNNDLIVDNDFVAPLAAAFESEQDIGAAGPALRYPDGRYQLSTGTAPSLKAEHREKARQLQMRRGDGALYEQASAEADTGRDVDWLTGAVLMIPRNVFAAVGGFDEEYPFYFEDADICRRILAHGWRIVYRPLSRVVHICGGSSEQRSPALTRAYRIGQLRYYSRHNTRSSFVLLKFFLLLRFSLAALRGQMKWKDARALAASVLACPFRITRNQSEVTE